MTRHFTVTALAIGLALWPAAWADGTTSGKPTTTRAAAAKPPTTQPTAEAQDPAVTAAMECYARVTEYYLTSRLDKAKAELRLSTRHLAKMTPQARADLIHVRRSLPGHRPAWWKHCRSGSNVSFRAQIWNRSFTANYMPSESFGFQAPVGIKDGKIQIIVSWQPNMVDNDEAFTHPFAKDRHLTKGHVGEAIIWHELGHNYITNFLPLAQVIKLYDEHIMLFSHLQEFYADMTSLYHCSPRARLAMLWMRLDSLRYYSAAECHTRAAHAIGALILANVLTKPEKWPSVHFPPKVPESRIELNTLVYVLNNLEAKWSIAEDRALREMLKKFIFAQGEKVLRSRGTLSLPNRQSFKVVATDDRDLQPKRDAWVAGRLKAIIAAGRADKPKKAVKREIRITPDGIEIRIPVDK